MLQLKPTMERVAIHWTPAQWTALYWLLGVPPNEVARVKATDKYWIQYSYKQEA